MYVFVVSCDVLDEVWSGFSFEGERGREDNAPPPPTPPAVIFALGRGGLFRQIFLLFFPLRSAV